MSPGPEIALTEASRVLVAGGLLAVFDGDYATSTCACGDFDPLQACAEACVDYLVHDRWLIRRLPKLVRAAEFELRRFRGHSYMEAPSSEGYMLAIVDRGADALLASGRIALETANALKAEARRRSDAGEFFGHIAYASLIAQKLWLTRAGTEDAQTSNRSCWHDRQRVVVPGHTPAGDHGRSGPGRRAPARRTLARPLPDDLGACRSSCSRSRRDPPSGPSSSWMLPGRCVAPGSIAWSTAHASPMQSSGPAAPRRRRSSRL